MAVVHVRFDFSEEEDFKGQYVSINEFFEELVEQGVVLAGEVKQQMRDSLLSLTDVAYTYGWNSHAVKSGEVNLEGV